MLLKIVYVLVRWLLSLAILVFRGDRAKDAELLELRHENAVLRRHVGRVRYEPADRVWFAALAGLIPRTRWTASLPCDASDIARLAPQAGREEVRHKQAARAGPHARRQSGASHALSSVWRRRIHGGDTAGSTAK